MMIALAIPGLILAILALHVIWMFWVSAIIDDVNRKRRSDDRIPPLLTPTTFTLYNPRHSLFRLLREHRAYYPSLRKAKLLQFTIAGIAIFLACAAITGIILAAMWDFSP